MIEPTDKELEAFAIEEQFLLFCDVDEFTQIARAALAKWGNSAVAGEQVGWMWQHDETGRTGFVDCWQVENGWQDGNPRLRLISKLYATPQPTQAQPVACEPLTCEWAHNEDDGFWETECGQSWRFDDGGPKENHMNFCHCCGKPLRIKGGQHGTE